MHAPLPLTTAPQRPDRPRPPTPARPDANAYVIEVAGTAAGIVAADRRGFRFHAASSRFGALDGLTFRTPAEAERAVRQLLRPAVRGPIHIPPAAASHRI